MRNIHYKVKTFRIAEKVYAMLKKEKPKDKTWNLYFKKLLEKDKRK